MAQYDSEKVFDALAIRSTSNQTSIISDHRVFSPKTIAVANGLNQTVTFQLQGSEDAAFTNVFNIGATFDVTASTNKWENATVYFPFMRLVASCTTAPTTGTMTAWFLKRE